MKLKHVPYFKLIVVPLAAFVYFVFCYKSDQSVAKNQQHMIDMWAARDSTIPAYASLIRYHDTYGYRVTPEPVPFEGGYVTVVRTSLMMSSAMLRPEGSPPIGLLVGRFYATKQNAEKGIHALVEVTVSDNFAEARMEKATNGSR